MIDYFPHPPFPPLPTKGISITIRAIVLFTTLDSLQNPSSQAVVISTMMDDRHASLIPSCPYGTWKCSNYVASLGGIGALLTFGVAIVRQVLHPNAVPLLMSLRSLGS
ncbi:hypothetical protein BDV27DRAFT_138670 [Aspergillus caelatus]|uniref:Uncharacterized protein n=1 Tax=Aspergillus caelatus TaxID=61420 RepID=A0A5N6ZNR2_9EURO|nr:uncharacterized protein BDV27DRAFT_138670 [Aspergillus caelatus]KAE8357810.1 hypothetical protein BDV27DRAFT_138670 [Aspergillus caelatus]